MIVIKTWHNNTVGCSRTQGTLLSQLLSPGMLSTVFHGITTLLASPTGISDRSILLHSQQSKTPIFGSKMTMERPETPAGEGYNTVGCRTQGTLHCLIYYHQECHQQYLRSMLSAIDTLGLCKADKAAWELRLSNDKGTCKEIKHNTIHDNHICTPGLGKSHVQ